jgi:hypothetical protein
MCDRAGLRAEGPSGMDATVLIWQASKKVGIESKNTKA